jgi:hypothetical protein
MMLHDYYRRPDAARMAPATLHFALTEMRLQLTRLHAFLASDGPAVGFQMPLGDMVIDIDIDDDDSDGDSPDAVDAALAALDSSVLDANDVPAVNADPCSVCYTPYEAGDRRSMLRCGHAYHTECIQPWLRQSGGKCALCNQRCGDV